MEEKRAKFKPLQLTCVDCDQTFIFSAEEQQFFWSKGLSQPKRCKDCREARKKTIIKEL